MRRARRSGTGAASSSSSSETTGITARVGGVEVAADMLVGADGANGVVAKTAGLDAGIVRGVALEGNVPWSLLDADRFATTAVIEFGAPPGGYGWLFPKGDHANLGVGGWESEGPHLREHLARLARAYAVDPAAIVDVRGHRLPMRRLGASIPGRDHVLLVGDAAGLVDPLSGDGMYEAFTSARLASEAILAGNVARLRDGARAGARPSRRRVLGRKACRRPASGRLFLGRALTGRVRRRRRSAARRRQASERGARACPAAAAARCPRRAPGLNRADLECAPLPADRGKEVRPRCRCCLRRD